MTLDLDILYFPGDPPCAIDNLVETLASFLREQIGTQFEVREFSASKDPFDPLRHDVITITDDYDKEKNK